LTELNLCKNRINTIETGTIYNLPELKTIYLQLNNISLLQTGSFNCLKNLTGLYIDTDSIVNIEEAAFNEIPNFRKFTNGNSLFPNNRMEDQLSKTFIEWSTNFIDKFSRLKEFYRVNVNNEFDCLCLYQRE
jgi:hypothetical protein